MFSRLHKCTVKLIATGCFEGKQYKNKIKEGWTELQKSTGVKHDDSKANSPSSYRKMGILKWLP